MSDHDSFPFLFPSNDKRDTREWSVRCVLPLFEGNAVAAASDFGFVDESRFERSSPPNSALVPLWNPLPKIRRGKKLIPNNDIFWRALSEPAGGGRATGASTSWPNTANDPPPPSQPLLENLTRCWCCCCCLMSIVWIVDSSEVT